MAKATINSANSWLVLDLAHAEYLATSRAAVDVQLEISGTFVGTLTLQWRLSNPEETDGDYRDVPGGRYTAPDSDILHVKPTWKLRCGFKAGEYTSGAARVVLI